MSEETTSDLNGVPVISITSPTVGSVRLLCRAKAIHRIEESWFIAVMYLWWHVDCLVGNADVGTAFFLRIRLAA